jgi:hypothetical protein
MMKKWNLMALLDNRSAEGGDVDRGQRLYVAMLILAGMIVVGAIAELATRSFRE